MFARADQLRIADIEKDFPYHALHFGWEDYAPRLLLFDRNDESLRMMNFHETLSISIGKRRVCTGLFRGEDYLPCPNTRRVGRFAQCADCGEELIPIQECLFEPRCDGGLCDSPICKRDHAIYIAFFGAKKKVGMTLRSRVRSRLIEQGADAYFVVGTSGTRKGARDIEKMISKRMRITERPSSTTVIGSMRIRRKKGYIEEQWAGISKTLEDKLSLNPGELHFLEDYPIEEPLKAEPKIIEPWGAHSGRIVGVKGKFLIYEAERLSALNLAYLPARYILAEMQ